MPQEWYSSTVSPLTHLHVHIILSVLLQIDQIDAATARYAEELTQKMVYFSIAFVVASQEQECM